MTTTFKTTAGAERAVHTVPCYYERVSVVAHGGGYVLACWRGRVSRPEDGRVYGPRGRVLADGVEASERLLGI